MNRLLFLLLAAAAICSASSCSFYRHITGRKPAAAVADSSLAGKDSLQLSHDTLVAKSDSAAVAPSQKDSAGQVLLQKLLPLWNAQTVWNTFNGKAKVHFDGKGESQDFAAIIRMEKGKKIWINVSVLGGLYEVARVFITPDSILILDRYNKEVRMMAFSERSSLIPVHADFASLQSLIIGDVLPTGHQPSAAKDTANALMLRFDSPELSQSVQFEKPDTLLHFQAIATPAASLLYEYGNWNRSSGRRFANSRILQMTDKGTPYSLNLEFSKSDFDTPVEMPFSIPEKYGRK